MSRKYNGQDKALFQQLFLQFAWMPPAHLVGLMQTMAKAGALPEKWSSFHPATASRWIKAGEWRDQVDALACFVTGDSGPLPSDDAIDDLVMRRNLQMFDLVSAQILGGASGDPQHALKSYLVLQREIRTQVQHRRNVGLTPDQLIELFLRTGEYVAGKAFDVQRAKEVLIQALSGARQLTPISGVGFESNAA